MVRVNEEPHQAMLVYCDESKSQPKFWHYLQHLVATWQKKIHPSDTWAPLCSAASIHDTIFFSGICRCLFWDEGHKDNSAQCVVLFVWEMDQMTAWVASGSRSDSLSTSLGINKVTKVKDTEKAGPDGQPASQRGGKCFKIYTQKCRG